MADSPDVLAVIEARHKPFGVYDECGHQHAEEEIGIGGVVVVEELDAPYTCGAGLLYTICSTCGTKNGEVYEDSDEPEFAWPCDTHRALTGWKKAEEERRRLVEALQRISTYGDGMFRDGLEADLHEAGVTAVADAYRLGLDDAAEIAREAISAVKESSK